MKRGEVWWASLPAPSGSGPGFRRPAVVVQSNPFNQSRITTVLVASLSSHLALAQAPGNVRIGKGDSGLSKPSVVKVSQLITLDRSLLSGRVRALPADAMRKIDDGLRLILAL